MFYQLVKWIINQKSIISIWYSDNKEGFLCKENRIVSFGSIDDVSRYALREGITLDDDVSEFDIDRLLHWINSDDLQVDCKEILNLWNIFVDISSSIESEFLGNEKTPKINNCYDKLFFGNNVLVDNEAEKYYPNWSKSEVNTIKKVLKNGIDMLGIALEQPV